MAQLLSSVKSSDVKQRFYIHSYIGGRITVLDGQTATYHLIQTNDAKEAAHMMNYSDEQWEVWIESAVTRGKSGGKPPSPAKE